MKVIETNYGLDPYVPTEETLFKQLQSNDIDTDRILIKLPTTHLINTLGLHRTQQIIDDFSKKNKEQKVFISQHIWTKKLKFCDDDLVFTPHAYLRHSYKSIPHYSLTYDKSKIREDKDILFSFFGAPNNLVRQEIIRNLENCDSHKMGWGIDKRIKPEVKKRNTERYIDLMGRSIFSLCPRGTGISTIRLFEVMAMESIPVIYADNFKPPLNDFLDWSEFSVFIKEKDAIKTNKILKEYNQSDIDNMKNNLVSIYDKYFSNENLYMSVKMELEKK
ncbi:MAG: exostosin family protein [Candidatus Riesia sp.]|nr:exostosin family protein [Candidatus Riesia sp.]